MANPTIGDLDDEARRRLCIRAAGNARSMEEEARAVLREALGCGADECAAPPEDLASAIHDLFAPLGGLEIDLPPREKVREPPDFNSPEYDRT